MQINEYVAKWKCLEQNQGEIILGENHRLQFEINDFGNNNL